MGGHVQDDSVTTTPRKRKRRGKRSKTDAQGLVDILPVGGSFTQENGLLEDSQSGERLDSGSEEAVELLIGDVQLASGADGAVPLKSNGQSHSSANEGPSSADTTQGMRSISESAQSISQDLPNTERDVGSQIPKHPEMRLGQ